MGCTSSKGVDSKASRTARWRSTGIVALRDSKLKTFPDEVFDLERSVRTIDLTRNKIADIPMDIGKLINLQRLVLAENLIDRLPMHVSKLESLKVMTLDSNRITSLPDELGQLVRLERLSISKNSLSCLPETIGSLRNLVLLNVSNNKLKSLPESVGSCFSLEELQADDNSIEDLPESICNLGHLKSLCLDNNNVKQIPTNLLKDCKALQNISLHGNPISMDQFQQMEGFQEFEARRKKKFDKQIDSNVMISSKGLDEGDRRSSSRFVDLGFDLINMVQKRPLDDEQIFVSFKHPRQVGHSKELVSFSESVFAGDVFKPQTLEDGSERCTNGGEEKHSGDVYASLPTVGEDIKASAPGSFTNSSWTASTTRGEDSFPQAPCHGFYFPEYFNPERPIRTLASEDIYSFLLDHSPRKSASIGPEHQAVIPLWGAYGVNNTSSSSHLDTSQAVVDSDLENEKRLMGTCVIPMPNSELSTDCESIVGRGRTNCSCEDRASIRCVRQHILEAREKLIKNIGPERFAELGFCDMGEQVAEKWSDYEEKLFHQVVFSNPASLDKNFWDNLSAVFPLRTKMEIVSYYFNVFMLRKRARQNRYDPVNVDSDNDEWEGSTVHGDNEPGVTDDDDSVVDSPGYQNDPGFIKSWGGDMQEYDEDVVDDACDNVNVDIYGGSGKQISDRCPGNLVNNGGSSPIVQFQKNIAWDEKGDQEVQDDSCTSFEAGVASQDKDNQLRSENGDHWEVGCFNGTSKLGDHEYVLEPCDAKVWDTGYSTCRKNKVDFLPTCNMIEEVFGKDSWNSYKARDARVELESSLHTIIKRSRIAIPLMLLTLCLCEVAGSFRDKEHLSSNRDQNLKISDFSTFLVTEENM
ncbi:hypothetical protein ACLB2K_052085 [Fragaria x ananassa]